MLHHYEYTPSDAYDSPVLFFNVAEARLYAQPVEYEDFPYSEGFIQLATAHEFIPEHMHHIPEDKIRPSLVGHIEMKKKSGGTELCTLMLDGHHSAAIRMMRSQTVELQFVPTAIMNTLAKHSIEELMNQSLIVLESYAGKRNQVEGI
jgi:hypothetical protein